MNLMRFNLVTVVIITTFVHLISGRHNSEMKLVSQLSDHFNFDHHIFLLDPSIDADRFVNKTNVTPRTLLSLSRNDLTTIRDKNAFTIVVPSERSTDIDGNFTHLEQMKNIQRLQVNMKIGIFFLKFTPIENLRKLFGWCRQELIVNIFAAAYTDSSHADSLNIFSFHLFKTSDEINVTNYTNDSVFPSLDSNFNQHRLILSDEMDNYQNTLEINFWDIALRLMNASSFQVVQNLTDPYDVNRDPRKLELNKYLNIYPMKKNSSSYRKHRHIPIFPPMFWLSSSMNSSDIFSFY